MPVIYLDDTNSWLCACQRCRIYPRTYTVLQKFESCLLRDPDCCIHGFREPHRCPQCSAAAHRYVKPIKAKSKPGGKVKTSIILLCALVLTGCGVQLPFTKGKAEFEAGKIKVMEYESTKAQSGFDGEYNPETNNFSIHTDNADSPRGYENYVEAQMMIELKRLEFYKAMVDALISAGKSAAPVPVPQ